MILKTIDKINHLEEIVKLWNENMKNLNHNINNIRQLNFFIIYIIFLSFLKGMASGLGWKLGAIILVSIFIFVLFTIEFIPVLVELVSRLILEIETFDRNK